MPRRKASGRLGTATRLGAGDCFYLSDVVMSRPGVVTTLALLFLLFIILSDHEIVTVMVMITMHALLFLYFWFNSRSRKRACRTG